MNFKLFESSHKFLNIHIYLQYYLWNFFYIVMPSQQSLFSETYFINFNAWNEFLCLQCQFQCLKWILVLTMLPISIVPTGHSNDSHQCPILAADLLWDRKWTAYLYPSLTSRPCLDGFFIFYPIIKNNKVSCKYGTLMWIIAVVLPNPTI